MSPTHEPLSPPLHDAVEQRVEAILTDAIGSEPLPVILDALRLDGLHVRLKGLRSELVIPPIGSPVRLQFRVGSVSWALTGRVAGRKPFVIRPDGEVRTLDSRASARVHPKGLGVAKVDSGKGPIDALIGDLSVGGCGLRFAAEPTFVVGQVVSVRVPGPGGELCCLGTVWFRFTKAGEVRMGVQFGVLTEAATRLLHRWTSAAG